MVRVDFGAAYCSAPSFLVAQGNGVRACLERWPPDQGWVDHACIPVEIPHVIVDMHATKSIVRGVASTKRKGWKEA